MTVKLCEGIGKFDGGAVGLPDGPTAVDGSTKPVPESPAAELPPPSARGYRLGASLGRQRGRGSRCSGGGSSQG